MQLSGKIAIVTGTASGIGQATALAMLREGVVVLGVDRQEQQSNSFGASFTPMQIDLASPSAPTDILKECSSRLGSPDILINNAGIGDSAPLTDLTQERYKEFLTIDLIAPAMLIREYILERGDRGGCIVNISSILSLTGSIRGAAYSEAKAGVAALTRQVATEFGYKGFRINAIAPGFIATALTRDRLSSNSWFRETFIDRSPLRRPGTPEEIANICLFLSSPLSSFIHGATIVADGGMSIATYPPQPVQCCHKPTWGTT